MGTQQGTACPDNIWERCPQVSGAERRTYQVVKLSHGKGGLHHPWALLHRHAWVNCAISMKRFSMVYWNGTPPRSGRRKSCRLALLAKNLHGTTFLYLSFLSQKTTKTFILKNCKNQCVKFIYWIPSFNVYILIWSIKWNKLCMRYSLSFLFF